MTREIQETDTFEGTLQGGESATLQVHSATATDAVLFIDNGTTGSKTSQYDIEEDIFVPALDDFMAAARSSGNDALKQEIDPRGADLRVTVTNTSGSEDTYRLALSCFKDF
jgi:hypothetical protein